MAPKQPAHIVVIEDNAHMAEMIKDFLTEKFSGIRLTAYKTGEEALAALQEAPTAVLLDYNLDTQNTDALNGIQVMMQLKQKFDVPVVFLTAQERPDIAASIMKHGAVDYVVKNQQSFGKLERTVRQILEKPQEKKAADSKTWLIVLLVVAIVLLAVFLFR
jgi:two-component system repressor protein LuxO